MIVCTVHEQPDPPADRIDRADALVFVRDGFSLPATLLAPFWLLAKQLWLPFLVYAMLVAAIGVGAWTLGVASGWASLLVWTLNVLVGLEADALERAELSRRGYATIGTVSGRSQGECERRFFDDWLPSQPMIAPLSSGTAGSLSAATGAVAGVAPARRGGGWRGLMRGA